MNKDSIIETLYNVLDYLETDDYDDTCTYHIEMINELKEVINDLKKESDK